MFHLRVGVVLLADNSYKIVRDLSVDTEGDIDLTLDLLSVLTKCHEVCGDLVQFVQQDMVSTEESQLGVRK